MIAQKLRGVLTPIVTPFKASEVDYAAFDHLVRWQADHGVSGLVLNTLTAEGPTITAIERRSLISRAVNLYRGYGIIAVATGSCCTKTTILQTDEAYQLGADFALVVQPFYNRPTQKGIIDHFEQVAGRASIPIIVDNDPQHAGVALKAETVATILRIPKIVGILQNSLPAVPTFLPLPDQTMFGRFIQTASRSEKTRYSHPQRFCIVSPLANVIPDVLVRFQEAQLGNALDLEGLVESITHMIKAFEKDGETASLKQAVSCVRGISNEVRLPLTPVSSETIKSIDYALRKVQSVKPDLGVHSLMQEAKAARGQSNRIRFP